MQPCSTRCYGASKGSRPGCRSSTRRSRHRLAPHGAAGPTDLGHLPVVGECARRRPSRPPSPASWWTPGGPAGTSSPRIRRRRRERAARHPLEPAWQVFADDGYGATHVSTRTHRILWSGWARTAHAQRRLGVRMNLDAYISGSALKRPDGRWPHGHLIGSGLPLRLGPGSRHARRLLPATDADRRRTPGRVFGGIARPDRGTRGPRRDAEIVRQATGRTPPPCAASSMPTASSAPPRVRAAEMLLDGTLAACRAAGVPVWTAARWPPFSMRGARSPARPGRMWSPAGASRLVRRRIGAAMAPGAGVLLPATVDGRALARRDR